MIIRALLLSSLSLVLPASALAHGGQAHSQSSALPRLQLLAAERNLDADKLLSGQGAEMAVVSWGANLRFSMQRTKKGVVSFQRAAGKRYHLPKGSVALSRGLLEGIGLELSRDGVVVQRRFISWCPQGTAPLKDTDGQMPWMTPGFDAGCGEALSLYIDGGLDRGWFDSLRSLSGGLMMPFIDEQGAESQEGSLGVPEPGDYRLKVTLDPKRVFHLHRRSSVSRTFNLRITQELYDRVKAESEMPPEEESLAQASASPVLPDLRVMPAFSIGLTPDEAGQGEILSFSAIVWNDSEVPLLVRARRSKLTSKSMTAYQTVVDRSGRSAKTFKIGKLVWDNRDGHSHWHYDGLARYRILKDGKPVATSGKVGFCFVNTTPVDSRLFPSGKQLLANQRYGNLGCGYRWSLMVGMEMDGGWGDTYSQNVAGQAFDTSSLPNGRYTLEVKANTGPYARIKEKRSDNNTAHRSFVISGQPGERYVEVDPWAGESG